MNGKLKVCLIGATAVGKSSLLTRFVSSIFRERYATTIGVTIQMRRVERAGRSVDLVIWDLSGEDEFQSVQSAYLRGAAGYLVVIDGTRRETVDTALILQARAESVVGDAPFVVVLNKSDSMASWDLDTTTVDALERRGWTVVRTSAKTGQEVDEPFHQLVDGILRRHEQTRAWT